MKGCLTALGIVVGVAILAVGFFWLNFYDVHVRYRLTVEVQDGDQIKTGSSVIDVSYNIEPEWSPSHFNSFPTPVGYAPTVDLGEKGMLFLTFSNATRTHEQRRERHKQTLACLTISGVCRLRLITSPAVVPTSGRRRWPSINCFVKAGRATCPLLPCLNSFDS